MSRISEKVRTHRYSELRARRFSWISNADGQALITKYFITIVEPEAMPASAGSVLGPAAALASAARAYDVFQIILKVLVQSITAAAITAVVAFAAAVRGLDDAAWLPLSWLVFGRFASPDV